MIAEKIIEKEKITDYILVYYYITENEKVLHYYKRLAAKANHAFLVKKQNTLLRTAVAPLFVSRKLKRCFSPDGIVYCGNIKTIYTRLPIYLSKCNNLHSFDDGIGNVLGQGYFYQDRQPGMINRLARKVGIDFSYSYIYGLIKKHYTIYHAPNAMPHCEYISVFNFESDVTSALTDEVAVLLTSTNFEDGIMTLEQEIQLYGEVIKIFNVRYVIPHPLEQKPKVTDDSVKIITSHEIAEEIVMDLRKKYKKILVLAWYSSALIHLSEVEGITAINIDFEGSSLMDIPKAFFESQNVKTYIPVNGRTI